jgi:hypothetical protein
MKKKLAILLAAVMTLAPINIFAATPSTTVNDNTLAPGKTLFIDTVKSYTIESVDSDDVKAVTKAPNITIKPGQTIAANAGAAVELELTNAEFYIKDAKDIDKHNNSNVKAGVASFNANGNTYNNNNFSWDPDTRTLTTSGSALGAQYTLQVYGTDDKKATLTFLSELQEDIPITIPIIALTNADAAATVRINSNINEIKGGLYNFAQGAKNSGTVAKPGDLISGKSTLAINKITVTESNPGNFNPAETFKLTVTSGYTFSKNSVTVKASGGFDRSADKAYDTGKTVTGSLNSDRDELTLTLAGLKKSTTTRGEFSIEGIILIPEDDASYDEEVKITLKDAGLTEQSVLVAKRSDYKVSWKVLEADKTPTIVTGRYDNEKSSEQSDVHKTAKIEFKEEVAASWWSGRSTVFEVPEGVKIRSVRFTKIDNIENKEGSGYIQDKEKYYTVSEEKVTSGKSLATKKTLDAVRLDSRTITLDNIKVKDPAKITKFELQLWVSVDPNFEGDVTLSSGNAFSGELEPLVIAHTQQPITVETKVTDVVIGLQSQKVADFTIKETDKGMLKKDKQVEIVLDDEFAEKDGISFDSQSILKNVEITGDIKISDVKASGGSISFTISRASTKASSITFKDLSVKVNRNVPRSNLRPYRLIVGGTAVAENYTKAETIKFDMFDTKGYKKDYLNVVTDENYTANQLKSVVKVTIGDANVVVGDKVVAIDVAPYIKNGTTMVPVRFIVQCLGIAEEKVTFDDIKRIVTIRYGTEIIQIKVGSPEATVNSNTITLTDANGKPVNAEITEGRTFVPFRALGNLLGVKVTWEEETKTAIYNQQ